MQMTIGVAGNWSYNSYVTYTCDVGYSLTSNLPMICSIDGSWNSTLPTCEMVTCLPPITPINGSYLPETELYNFTDVVEFSCLHGFDRIGSSTSSCNSTGQWSVDSPLCQIKDCGSLLNPPNGVVWHRDGTTVGQSANYSCYEGYTLNGTDSRTCNASGNWTSAAPTCHVIRKFYIKCCLSIKRKIQALHWSLDNLVFKIVHRQCTSCLHFIQFIDNKYMSKTLT